MAAISSSLKPCSARDADHDGGRPPRLEKTVSLEELRVDKFIRFIHMYIVLSRAEFVSIW